MNATRRRLQGLAFILVIALLIGLAVAQYAGAFRTGVPVTLQVDRVGNQLAERADVKVRGLIVGQVEQVSSDGTGATVQLSLRPEMVDQIPANVEARLLPKTLFGEKYVSLVPPAQPATARLSAGDVISQDRSEAARELERVLDGLLPLLHAVAPQQLATTLGALSQALSGRGEQLGQTLVQLQQLVGPLNAELPNLQADITGLADLAENVADAAPDLLDALEDITVTSRTVMEQREHLRTLFGTATQASDDLHAFLAANRDNLIGLAASSRPTLESLARYAPEFPCLFGQLADLVPLVDDVFGVGTDEPGLHLTVEIVNSRGKYIPNQDEPRYLDDRGPRCYPVLPLGPQYPPDGPFKDGSTPPAAPLDTPTGDPEAFGADTFGTTPASWGSADMGLPNSPGEQQIVAELVAAQSGGPPSAVPSWSSMLVGPLYRGTEVTLT
ncbi:MCE family protein [Pseudonocardia bannensis]|uniref:MCE family protein n=1 Tax=Pseudonocardia bannensis TaxID=630973 RepID=A0A848DPV4_9PSEU|nr:MCE family protein [Pseudonocardia bannensis]NMH94421.1 MCE family protein [Pseudonocardia bannensis]